MRMFPRYFNWNVEHTQRCIMVSTGARNARGRTAWRRQCTAQSTPPPAMTAADGQRIPFTRRLYRHEAYETAVSVNVEIWLDVDTGGAADQEDAFEAQMDGEIDIADLEGNYDYIALINIRQPSSWNPITWPDLITHPRVLATSTPLSVLQSMLTPSALSGEDSFTRRAGGRTIHYSVHF